MSVTASLIPDALATIVFDRSMDTNYQDVPAGWTIGGQPIIALGFDNDTTVIINVAPPDSVTPGEAYDFPATDAIRPIGGDETGPDSGTTD